MALNLMVEGETFDVCDTELQGVTDGDPDVMYTVKRLDPKTHRAMTKARTKKEFVRGVGQVDKLDARELADDILDYILVGWRGVLLKGEPAPCTREFKIGGLDFTRRAALVERAGMNEIDRAPERRAESFRPTPISV